MKSKNIIFVPGMYGWGEKELGGLPYWGKALSLAPSRFSVHAASCGPISSFHDRACEVVAQIKGTEVDYGEAHSSQAGHDQHPYPPEKHEAFVQDWSEDNPVILIGHSAGGHTCLQLQKLLAEDYWKWGSTENWIEAIILISPVLNGSTLTYRYGCDKKTGLLTEPLSKFLDHAVQLLDLLSIPSSYDFHLGQWRLPKHKSSPKDALLKVLKGTNYAKGEDNLPFDLTLQGCHKANEACKTFPGTYYLSIVTERTTNGVPETGIISEGIRSVLASSAEYQGQVMDFKVSPIKGWGSGDLTIDKWRENDGAVSSISQKYPFTAGNHPVGGEGIFNRQLDKGKWYFEKVEKITGRRFDHFDPTLGYRMLRFTHLFSNVRTAHKELYKKIYELLGQL